MSVTQIVLLESERLANLILWRRTKLRLTIETNGQMSSIDLSQQRSSGEGSMNKTDEPDIDSLPCQEALIQNDSDVSLINSDEVGTSKGKARLCPELCDYITKYKVKNKNSEFDWVYPLRCERR